MNSNQEDMLVSQRDPSEEYFRVAVESAPSAMVLVNRDGKIVLINAQTEKVFGYSREELLGRSVEVLVPPAGAGRDLYARRKNGERFPVEIGLNPVETKEGPWVLSSIVDITARKQAENYRLQLAAIVEFSDDAIIAETLDGAIVSWNAGAAILYGYPAEEVLGRSISLLIPPDQPDDFPGILDKLRRGEHVAHYETVRLTKDGRRIDVSVTMSPIKDSKNKVCGASAVARDITDRKRTERQVREREDRFRIMADKSPVMIWVSGLDTGCTFFNKPWLEFTGRTLEQEMGNGWSEGVHPEDRQNCLDIHLAAFEARKPFRTEYRLRRGDDAYRWILDTGVARTEADGSFAGYIGSCIDISERKEAEEYRRQANERLEDRVEQRRRELSTAATALQAGAQERLAEITRRRQAQCDLEKSERRYRLLFDNNPQPMWVYDCKTLAFLAVNNAAIRSYGYTREEFLGMAIKDIRPAEDVPALLEDIRKANTDLHTDGPWRHKKKDGTILVVEISSHLIQFGEQDARFVMVTDITERKKLEEQFRQAQRLESIGRLTGGVAHDFNNLLIVINGYSQMLLKGLPEDHAMREGLTQIGEAGKRGGALTKQLLACSRKQVLKPIVLNLNQEVADTKKMLQRLIGEDIDLVTRLAPALGNTLADDSQLQQVIMNLAVNARDALPNGGTLLIETANVTFDEPYCEAHPDAHPGSYVMLGVTDNGAGMTPEVRERLFEPFFTTKPPGAGTGLGLATVHGIVKQNSGWIRVHSEVGRGTTFKIYLPQVDALLPDSRPVSKRELRGNETILLVEDQPEVRAFALVALQHYGYTVYSAGSGDEAVAFCRQFTEPLHLLLTDVVMAGMNGPELAKEMATLRPGLRVLFMSGYTDNVISHQGVLHQDVAYVQKPFTAESLAEKIRAAFDV